APGRCREIGRQRSPNGLETFAAVFAVYGQTATLSSTYGNCPSGRAGRIQRLDPRQACYCLTVVRDERAHSRVRKFNGSARLVLGTNRRYELPHQLAVCRAAALDGVTTR